MNALYDKIHAKVDESPIFVEAKSKQVLPIDFEIDEIFFDAMIVLKKELEAENLLETVKELQKMYIDQTRLGYNKKHQIKYDPLMGVE
jgi:hypothetical protein